MPGPPPDKNARRRNARPDWRKLPKAGCDLEPPKFPLARPSRPVLALWADLWATPQAVAWHDLGWSRTVARYSKLVLQAEKANAATSLLGEVRQLEDRLGLTPMSMKRLQWEIDDRPIVPADQAERDGAEVTSIDAYRDLYG